MTDIIFTIGMFALVLNAVAAALFLIVLGIFYPYSFEFLKIIARRLDR